MRYFKKNEKEIDEYLKTRHEVVNIDGGMCSDSVKQRMLALLQKTPYLVGARKDFD